jgi:NAD(P)-dependent dehydrogenase (short-subunit alcohol dehydrogenase family)
MPAGPVLVFAGRPCWAVPMASDATKTALVTGANKGIGRAVAHRLAELGMTVLVAARDPDRGAEAVAALRAAGGDVHPLRLDVTDPASVAAAATEVADRFGRLDVLVNNAGIAGDRAGQRPGTAELAAVRAVFETNLFGVIAVTEALLPLLRRSAAARIVNISSGTGSMGRATDAVDYMSRLPAYLGYPVTKAALNMLTVQYGKSLAADGILVNAVAPGGCATDFTKGSRATITRTADQGAQIAVRMATLGHDGPTGGFFDDDGPVPW